MPKEIGREEVRQMVEDKAQLVEVLPREEYEVGCLKMPSKGHF
jgi:hypothetical protein